MAVFVALIILRVSIYALKYDTDARYPLGLLNRITWEQVSRCRGSGKKEYYVVDEVGREC